MAKFSLNKTFSVLVESERLDGIFGLLHEILVLQEKINNADKRDFHFQKGLKNHIAHLEALKKEYAEVVEVVNNNPVDYFMEMIAERERSIRNITAKGYVNSVEQIAILMLKQQIARLQHLLHIKGKWGTLEPLEVLMKDENALIMIFS